jgi:thioredoxin reductase (NADPH)
LENLLDLSAAYPILARLYVADQGRPARSPDDLQGRGVSYNASCDAAFFRNHRVAVAGNSGEAIEEAPFLTKFAQRVHFLSPTPDLMAEPNLIEAITSHPKATVHFGTALREVIGASRVEAVRAALRGQLEEIIPVAGAFICLQGGKPLTDRRGRGGCHRDREAAASPQTTGC